VVEKKSFFYSEGLPQKTVPFSKKKLYILPSYPAHTKRKQKNVNKHFQNVNKQREYVNIYNLSRA